MPESLIDTYNHLGLVYFERDDPNSSLESLHNAESIYKTYRDNNPLMFVIFKFQFVLYSYILFN